jgi:hypothetical protein
VRELFRKLASFGRSSPVARVETQPLDPSDREHPGKRLLVLAWYDPAGLQTILDHLRWTAHYSVHRYEVFNLFHCHGPEGLELPAGLDLHAFDGLVIHCTVSYSPVHLFSLDRARAREDKIAAFRGLKVLMKQDEHYRINRLVDYLEAADFDLLTTCLSPPEWEKVYPRRRLPRLKLVQTLTGYVSDELRAYGARPLADRPIDVGYRGSRQPFCFGRLCWEKQAIGDVFLPICARHGLKADISSRWEDRFMGKEWFEFLARCKATLGVESGASVFDFDGSIEQRCAELLKQNPSATFEEVHERFLREHEGKIDYAQISPRHFEAAACRSLQILYEGKYSGILVPWKHYVPLRRDLGNVDEVLEALRSETRRQEIVDRAFEEIVKSDQFHYSAFARQLDRELDAALAVKRA